MKKILINGVDWELDKLKNFICEEFGAYYGAYVRKSQIFAITSLDLPNGIDDSFTYISFSLKTPKSQIYNGGLLVHYIFCFNTHAFKRIS